VGNTAALEGTLVAGWRARYFEEWEVGMAWEMTARLLQSIVGYVGGTAAGFAADFVAGSVADIAPDPVAGIDTDFVDEPAVDCVG
jgi:hypothetical protein